jgi:hypothetical protein
MRAGVSAAYCCCELLLSPFRQLIVRFGLLNFQSGTALHAAAHRSKVNNSVETASFWEMTIPFEENLRAALKSSSITLTSICPTPHNFRVLVAGLFLSRPEATI